MQSSPPLVEERVASVASALRLIPRAAIDVIEFNDPQYLALKLLARRHGLKGLALVIGNALVSYRLSVTGEEYWREFAEVLAARPPPRDGSEAVRLLAWFLENSRGNRMMLRQKLARLRRAARLLGFAVEEPEKFLDLDSLHVMLRRALGVKGEEKTVVFAVKMAYYYFRALGLEPRGGAAIPLPVDRRVAVLTSSSMMVDAEPAVLLTPEGRRAALEAWRRVSATTGVPMMRLDALIWLPARGIEKALRLGLEHARDEYANRLVALTKGLVQWRVAWRVAGELLYRVPPGRLA